MDDAISSLCACLQLLTQPVSNSNLPLMWFIVFITVVHSCTYTHTHTHTYHFLVPCARQCGYAGASALRYRLGLLWAHSRQGTVSQCLLSKALITLTLAISTNYGFLSLIHTHTHTLLLTYVHYHIYSPSMCCYKEST